MVSPPSMGFARPTFGAKAVGAVFSSGGMQLRRTSSLCFRVDASSSARPFRWRCWRWSRIGLPPLYLFRNPHSNDCRGWTATRRIEFQMEEWSVRIQRVGRTIVRSPLALLKSFGVSSLHLSKAGVTRDICSGTEPSYAEYSTRMKKSSVRRLSAVKAEPSAAGQTFDRLHIIKEKVRLLRSLLTFFISLPRACPCPSRVIMKRILTTSKLSCQASGHSPKTSRVCKWTFSGSHAGGGNWLEEISKPWSFAEIGTCDASSMSQILHMVFPSEHDYFIAFNCWK